MNIFIKIIPHKEQRYETVGDWQFEKLHKGEQYIKVLTKEQSEFLGITVSDLADERMNCLVIFHELIEALLCKFSSPEVTAVQVDEFDTEFEKLRKPDDESESGDDPRAPYHSQHQIATVFEKEFARQLGVNWEEYNKKINEL
jgi:hypothetical protein